MLDYWVRQGRLKTEPRQRRKSGYPREFSPHEALVACWIAALVRAGFTLDRADVLARQAVALEGTPDPTLDLGDGLWLTWLRLPSLDMA